MRVIIAASTIPILPASGKHKVFSAGNRSAIRTRTQGVIERALGGLYVCRSGGAWNLDELGSGYTALLRRNATGADRGTRNDLLGSVLPFASAQPASALCPASSGGSLSALRA